MVTLNLEIDTPLSTRNTNGIIVLRPVKDGNAVKTTKAKENKIIDFTVNNENEYVSPDKIYERRKSRPKTSTNVHQRETERDKLSEGEEPRILIDPQSDTSGMPFTNSSIIKPHSSRQQR